jgi:phage FluMu protein Com
MDQCDHCKELNQIFKIETPGDLKKVIRVIADNLTDSTIVEGSSPMGKFSSVPFADLAKGEPWDDIVEYFFKCPKCGQKFSLWAETYHGRGGSWSPY